MYIYIYNLICRYLVIFALQMNHGCMAFVSVSLEWPTSYPHVSHWTQGIILRLFIAIRDNRRKFRSQTSDNMDRWKAETGRVREKRRVEERRSEKRKSQKKEDAGARKGRKVAKHCVFPMICGSGGSKSRLAKVAGADPAGQMRDEKLHTCGAKHISKSKCTTHTSSGPLLEVEMSKKCTLLWREAHFEVKMHKTHQVRTTFGSWDVEKVHAVVARSTFWNQNVQNTPGSDLEMSKKCTLLWREAHFEVKMYKARHVRATFGGSDVLSRGRRKGLYTFSKVSKMWGFCSISKNDDRRGTFEEDLQRCIFRGRRSTRDICIRAVRRSGRWFPERGCILEHQIFRFAKMILRDRCSTSCDLASLFRGRRSSLDRWTGKIAKRIGTRPSALHFWRKSRRILSFLMLSTSKNEEASQNCFVFDVVKLKYWGSSQNCFIFDVVNFEKWRSLAELLRFWRCQVQTLRKSRRIASFLMLSSSKPEDASHNSFVFKLADRQVDR